MPIKARQNTYYARILFSDPKTPKGPNVLTKNFLGGIKRFAIRDAAAICKLGVYNESESPAIRRKSQRFYKEKITSGPKSPTIDGFLMHKNVYSDSKLMAFLNSQMFREYYIIKIF